MRSSTSATGFGTGYGFGSRQARQPFSRKELGYFDGSTRKLPGPGHYDSARLLDSPFGRQRGGAPCDSFAMRFSMRSDFFGAAQGADLVAACTPKTQRRRSVLRTDPAPNWILSPTPLNESAEEVVLGMPGPGCRKGRGIPDYARA